ncbi:MAG TPA: hypothetical protein VKA64_03130, partial [Gammaproteobacteria bacterium]|nr:hypothetical protein [Gammaproteobacteria bacterium]
MTAGPSPRRVSWWARLSLTFKMVVATTLVGAVVWTGVYLVEASAMERLFRKQLQTQLDLLNVESRLRFDRHTKAFRTLLKLFPSLHRFEHYLNDARWQRGEPRLFQQPPPWFPPRSALRHLVHPRYALLIGPDGRVQEVYHSWESEVPEPLLEPHALLRETSHDQTRMTRIAGRPFLVASQAIAGEADRPRATVMLATPIDNEFLMASQELGATGEVTALITHGSPARVIASSDPGRVEPGDSVAALQERFMIAANPHFDYGASDLQLRLATLVPLQKMEAQVDTLLGVERRENLFAAGVFILVASLLMYLVTRRIERVGRRIRAFSDQVSGQQSPGETRSGGDQLIQLEEEFQRLTEEVEEAREAMGRQADLL